MQIILADAKIMRDGVAGVNVPLASTPLFQKEANAIADEMAGHDVPDIARLFHCSTAIAMENRWKKRLISTH